MQYLLSKEEYDKLLTVGSMKDHSLVMFLIDIIYQIANIADSAKRQSSLEAVSDKLELFKQSGNNIYIRDIQEMFE